MKHLLCWEDEDITNLKLNARTQSVVMFWLYNDVLWDLHWLGWYHKLWRPEKAEGDTGPGLQSLQSLQGKVPNSAGILRLRPDGGGDEGVEEGQRGRDEEMRVLCGGQQQDKGSKQVVGSRQPSGVSGKYFSCQHNRYSVTILFLSRWRTQRTRSVN